MPTSRPSAGKQRSPSNRASAKRNTPFDSISMGHYLDALVTRYKVPAYVQDDPIQIPYRFAADPLACELVAFITALFSYGRRNAIIDTMNRLFLLTEQDPLGFMRQFHPQRDSRLFQHFVYRFNKGADMIFLWERLQWVYQEYGSLEQLFAAEWQAAQNQSRPAQASQASSALKAGIAGTINQLLGHQPPRTYGLKFLLAHPDHGGACKRFNMFLRWMVRQDENPASRVDFGLWKHALTPADLVIPLDTHVLKMNRALRFSPRTDGSWQTAEEITAFFRQLCPHDPVRYDYALFGFSVAGGQPETLDFSVPLPAR